MFVKEGIAYAGEPAKGLAIASARVVNTLSLVVLFSNGETRLFDAAYLLELPVFEPLGNPETFDSFAIDHGAIAWLAGDLDLSPEEVYANSYSYEGVA